MNRNSFSHVEREAACAQPGPSTCPEALVFAIGDPRAVGAAAQGFFRNDAPNSVLEVVLAYVDQHRHQGAALIPLYPERAEAVLRGGPSMSPGPAQWELAVPDLRSRSRALSAYHYLRLASPQHRTQLENSLVQQVLHKAVLRRDPAVSYVHRPEIERPRRLRPDALDLAPGRRQWGMEECKFPEVWKFFEKGGDPGPIALVDMGGYNGHPDLKDAITMVREPPSNPSDSDHASVVAGVLAARRGLCDMLGCCWAHLHLYNVGVGEQLDCLTYYRALKEIAEDSRVRVVNLSLESCQYDALIAEQVHECVCRKKILVAAMGNTGGHDLIYPAAYPDVVAVGSINQSFVKDDLSTIGEHILLSAPGDWIFSVAGRRGCDKRNRGTSFAAPMVSAAVWLALRRRPELELGQIRRLLARSTTGDGTHSHDLGFGVLNMLKMVEVLRNMP